MILETTAIQPKLRKPRRFLRAASPPTPDPINPHTPVGKGAGWAVDDLSQKRRAVNSLSLKTIATNRSSRKWDIEMHRSPIAHP